MNVLHPTLATLALAIIMACSLIGIYHPRINDGVIGRMLYMVIAVLCMGGLAHLSHDALPRNILGWLLVAMAGVMVRELVRERYGNIARTRWILFVKTLRAKNATKHQR